MHLNAGEQLYSSISEVEVIVIKAPPGADVVLSCGDEPMAPKSEVKPGSGGSGGSGGSSAGTVPQGETILGKRYVDPELELEVLCTKAGAGALAANGRPLELKSPKPLPSSD